MVTTLKQGATKKNIQSILENLARELKPKGVDVYKYVGKISLSKDALAIQKALRNEWE
jgi:short-subunit dehydrogenase